MAQSSTDGEGDLPNSNQLKLDDEKYKQVETLYGTSYKKVISHVSRTGLNKADTEDAFQELFLEYLEEKKSLPDHVNFPVSFLRNSTRWTAQEITRAGYKREKAEGVFAQRKRLDAIPSLYNLVRYVEHDDIITVIRKNLSENEFALVLFAIEGKYSVKEIAARQGKTEVAMRKSMSRLRKKLHNVLVEYLEYQNDIMVRVKIQNEQHLAS
jgi:DNA-directed RNA polymerase specialized sigma24 family protein